jgi:myb proto-oncogene protein
MKKKIKWNLGSGSPEQLSPCPNDSMIPVGRDSTATSSQDSSNNIQVSSADLPVRPKSKHGLPESCRNVCTLKEKGSDSIHDGWSAPHSVHVSQMVDGQTVGSSLPILTEENLVSSLSSVGEKLSCVAPNSTKPLKEEESTKFLEIPQALACFQSSNSHSDVICSSGDPESRQLHLASIADLLDMSYCESLMVIAPDSRNEEDFMRGM